MASTNGKDVTLTIRAKDDASAVLKRIERAFNDIDPAEVGSKSTKMLRTVRLEGKKLGDEYAKVQQRIRALAKSGDTNSKIFKSEIAQARLLKNEIQNHQIAAQKLRNITSAAAKANIADSKAQETAINRVTQAEQRRQTVTRRGAGTLGGLRQSGSSFLQREGEALTSRQGRGFLGLRPYELQNLSYQINDVITGLASGQRPMQVFSQQIGQIAQIIPGVLLNLAKLSAGFIGPLAVLAPGIVRIKTFDNTLKELNKTLQLNADAAQYTVPALAKYVQQLDDTGLSAKEARASVVALMNAGIGQERFEGLIETARGLSAALGIDMSEAVEKTVDSFNNGVEGVRKLDQQLNFLTADQYSHIRALQAAGQETEAVEYAQSILQRRMDEVSGKAKGGWSQAWENLGNAFLKFSKMLADSRATKIFLREWNKFGQDIAKIAKEIETAADFLGDVASTSVDELAESVAQLRDELSTPNNPRYTDFFSGSANRRMDEEKLAALEVQLAAEKTAKAEEEAAAALEKAKEERQEQRKLQQDLQQSVDEQIKSLREEVELSELTKREQYIHQQILEAQNRAKEKGLKLSEDQLRVLREQSGITFDRTNSLSATGNFGSAVDRIIGIESGGNASAKNPNSSATGLGQFIESTWLSMFRKYFPDRAENMSREAILALRENASVSREMVELYARENAKILQDAGVAVNDAAVYLAHFLGPQGALNVLKADRNTSVANVLGADQINANRSILQGRTAGQVIDWAGRKMGISDQELAVQKELTSEAQKQADEERKATEQIDNQIQQMQFELSLQNQTDRQQAIATALREAELTAQKAGLELTKEQRAEITQLAAANWDRANAEKYATEQLNQLLERRALLMQQAQAAQTEGNETQFTKLREQVQQVDDQLVQAAEKAISFWESIGGPKADNAILKIRTTIAGLEQLNDKVLDGVEVNRQLADSGVQAMNQFGRAVAEGENVADAFWNAMRQGIANFIIEITNAIARQMILNALMGNGDAGGGLGGWIAGIGNAFVGVNHNGGIAGGSGGARRSVNLAAFGNAVRYHTGGIAGLKPNEVPSILERGEEVLTRDDPRHAANGGGGAVNIKQVNVLDPAEIFTAALQDEEGQRVLFNFVSRNAQKMNQSLNR